ncbi:phosphotransferase family protein [Actinocatenispora comari]|jgi:Ser/Thr protein kinase RdoA (MazF antagonist)|uniref:Aminoglycoside phosphotransferase domain-containing protein n=1 Tax=Actinocatenispora comari TaxID=2807577 RepID=A0A8J4AGS4_9ACTN|nr:phosphotransferase [Actinocatenispora comari]GIL28952.1 hypothetical protein NUM_42060 [Actinocatenispora comari]
MADDADIEVPLTGGRITPGVVRVGDTVCRPRLPTSDLVAELLIHLERQRFTGAPRYRGVDSYGRDVLTYLPGEVPARLQTFTDAQIQDAGALLRRLHDATRGCDLAGPRQVVCHRDPGPNNVVFRNDRPVAFIDFDTAAPGDPLDDLGYMAWLWCWTAKHAAPPVPVQARQVRLLADAYHLDADTRRCGLVDTMLASQLRNIDFWRQRAATTDDHEQADRMIAWTEHQYDHTTRHRDALDLALRR